MKFVQTLSRLALLSLVAAAFVALTATYGASIRTPMSDSRWREGRAHRPSAPEFARLPEVVGEVLIMAIYAVAGRIVLRLRLSPPSRTDGQLISLSLYRRRKDTRRENPQLPMVDPAP